jgi:O-antigen/teichoic acid export membrane protein
LKNTFEKLSKLLSSNKKFLQYNLFSYIVILFNIVTTIVTVRSNLDILKADYYGTWLIVLSISGLLGLVHLGFSTIGVFNHTKYKNSGKLALFYNSAFYVLLLQLGLLLSIFAGIYFIAPSIIKFTSHIPIFRKMLCLAFPGVIFNVMSGYLEMIMYYNFKQIYHRNILEFLRIGLQNICFLIALWYFRDIEVLPITYSCIAAIAFGFTVFKYSRIEKIAIGRLVNHFSYIKENYKDALSLWILGVSTVIISQADVLFISSYKGNMAMVAMYSQSFRLQEIALKFIKKITEIKIPKLYSLYNEKNYEGIIKLINKLLKISFILSISTFIFFTLFGKPILDFWLKNNIEFDQHLIMVASTLCITSSIHWVFWGFCTTTGIQKEIVHVVIIEIILNFVLSYILLRAIGLYGLCLASVISNLFTIIFIAKKFKSYKKIHTVV